MLSVLIPVYNYDVRDFVTELHRQALQCRIDFEIRCYDDASESHFREANRELEQLDHVVYEELPHNYGRSAIRNLLARDAVYPYLLFLDCDSYPEHDDFISRYVAELKPGILIYGGRTYDTGPPSNLKYLLHWKYGSAREVIPVDIRKAKPYHSFQTNNFVVPKDVFKAIGLNEGLKGYGHEDTQFGQQLMARSISIYHIDNPLRHLGLETCNEFIRKTDEGIINLHYLIHHGYDVSTIKLARYYRLLKKTGMAGITGWILHLIKKDLLKNLCSNHPGLLRFDLYKLCKLIETGK